jgi:hypothetical protein
VTHQCLRLWVIIIGLFLYSLPAHGRYRAPTLVDMVGNSDLVVLGVIESLTDKTYTLKIERVLAGKHLTPTITVARYRDWTCSRRWAPYAPSQRMVVFLNKRTDAKQDEARYRTRSGGSEGEMPVANGQVYINHFALSRQAPVKDLVYGAPFFGFRLGLDTVIDAITRFGQCFELVTRRSSRGGRRVVRTRRRCPIAATRMYAERSPFHDALVRDVFHSPSSSSASRTP